MNSRLGVMAARRDVLLRAFQVRGAAVASCPVLPSAVLAQKPW